MEKYAVSLKNVRNILSQKSFSNIFRAEINNTFLSNINRSLYFLIVTKICSKKCVLAETIGYILIESILLNMIS